MTTAALLTLALAAGPRAAAPGPLDGTWAVVTAEAAGRPAASDEPVEIRDGSMTFTTPEGRRATVRLTFGPDHAVRVASAPGQSPPLPPVPLTGVYVVVGNHLAMALGTPPGEARKPGPKGALMAFVLERRGPAPAAPGRTTPRR